MKKIVILIFCILFFVPQTRSFLGNDLGTNLFKDINEGVEELEFNQIEYELSGQGGKISEKINFVLQANSLGECINDSITLNDVEIIINGDLSILNNNINDTEGCRDESGNISINSLNKISSLIKSIYEEIKDIAQNKTKQLSYISRIGIYTDGNDNNSPFDLMTDLENIDYYIFSQEIPYEGEDIGNVSDLMDDILSGNDNNSNLTNLSNGTSNPQGGDGTNDNNGENENYNSIDENSPDEAYQCIDSNVNSELSGLDSDEFSSLLPLYSNTDNTNDDTGNGNNDASSGNNENSLNSGDDNLGGSYSKINDNSQFPCEGFFCITIEFLTYEHKLLSGGVTQTIDSLIGRSNKHLQKFAGTSLMQADATTNNFQLNLRNINLPDMFHVGVVVSTKPVPILDIQNDDEDKENDEFTKDNLLEEYYKNYGLDYIRKNDLDIFLQKEAELKTMLDSAELPITKAGQKDKEYNNLINKEINKSSLTTQTVIEKVINADSSNFEKRLIELNKFSSSILNYILNIDSIIREMNKIPVDKS